MGGASNLQQWASFRFESPPAANRKEENVYRRMGGSYLVKSRLVDVRLDKPKSAFYHCIDSLGSLSLDSHFFWENQEFLQKMFIILTP